MNYQNFGKRLFDGIVALVMLLFLWPVITITAFISSIVNRSNGFFVQERIGQYGRTFIIFKIKSINPHNGEITPFGKFLRRSKLDELPQLINILNGDMSFVGPRPDVPGYYDKLSGSDRRVLQLKPGLTSEASIKYKNEEALLSRQSHPLKYNDEVLFPDKVKMNLDYLDKISFLMDLKIILKTLF